MICQDREQSGDKELIKWAIYYTNKKSADTWTATREALTKNTWDAFKKAIGEIYPEAQPNCHHTIATLHAITEQYVAKRVNTESILAEYHREFAPIAAYLIKMHHITRHEANVLYISTFPTEYHPDITTQLTIKCPDVRPNDGYDLKEMNSAAQFIITSWPAIALLAATMPHTAPIAPPLPAPVPTPVPTPAPVAPAPPTVYATHPRPPPNFCIFCGSADHTSPAACPLHAEYVQQGKLVMVQGRAQLPNGGDLFTEHIGVTDNCLRIVSTDITWNTCKLP
ncbi:hypothetical protein AX14_005552 [Amanita brunnescens Koide BX004]|nr:hypothetical protein AX14_005552 [Amanita brunnescens Koide BX004]